MKNTNNPQQQYASKNDNKAGLQSNRNAAVDPLREEASYHKELSDMKFALDASSIVAITDRKGKITYVNDEFCRISKYNRSELIGADHRIINSGYHPKSFFKQLWETINQGEVWKGEIKNKSKDGSNYWVDTTIVPFLDGDERPYQFLAIRHEITNRKKAEEEIKNMMTRMINLQEDERKIISRDLHDGVGQNLYSHMITINRLQAELNHPLLEQLYTETAEIIEELRDISRELRPSVLDDLGLLPAIRSYLHRFSQYHQIDVQFTSNLNERLSTDKELTIYRIIQEALTNIRKYAGTNEAFVIIREHDHEIRVVIEDYGAGFDYEEIQKGVGLFSMEERAKVEGGSLDILSEKGRGTRVVLVMPI